MIELIPVIIWLLANMNVEFGDLEIIMVTELIDSVSGEPK